MGQNRGFQNINIQFDNIECTLYEQSYALIIGVSKYENGWPNLPGVKNDVNEVRNALIDHGFSVILIENPTDKEMEDEISDFIENYGLEMNTRLIIYFAGHGYTMKAQDGRDMGYIVPSNAPLPFESQSEFHKKAISMRNFDTWARNILSKHALFIFDACFSGSLFNISRAVPIPISAKTKEPVRQFITSGSENEEVPDRSLFREYFIKSLTTSDADGNNDGYLSGSELGEYLSYQVTNYSYDQQHPQYGKIRDKYLDKGDFVFILSNDNDKDETKLGIPVITNEVPIKKYGRIAIETQIEGKFFLDNSFQNMIEKNSRFVLHNIPFGIHVVRIEGIEIWEMEISIDNELITTVYANEMSSRNSSNKMDENAGVFKDKRDGSMYNWVKIGNQLWMSENLKFYINDSWCYENIDLNCDIYGRLYSWNNALVVCPDGWHLPDNSEWQELMTYLGKSNNAGGALKEEGTEHWSSPNHGASNTSKFTALPAGGRNVYKIFYGKGVNAFFWTSTQSYGKLAEVQKLFSAFDDITTRTENINHGFSVRCIKSQ
nr:caspase family protein [Bacteroidota bacterium]